jgi:hypothetical protein
MATLCAEVLSFRSLYRASSSFENKYLSLSLMKEEAFEKPLLATAMLGAVEAARCPDIAR